MASVLDLVKHYQHAIEKYSDDEQRVLKSIDKLFNLDVTVQHLQETGVGRTVNALRKEPGNVGHAARALVSKWKLMVAAEESDQEGDHNTDTKTYNGNDNGRDSDDSAKKLPRNKEYKQENLDSKVKIEKSQENGHYSGSKRRYQSSEEEEPEVKKSKSSSSNDNYQRKSNIKKEQSVSESDETDHSQSRESDSEMSELSEEEQEGKLKHKIKQEPPDNYKSKHSSSEKHHSDHKKEASSSRTNSESDKHLKNRPKSESTEKSTSEKSSSKDKSHSSHKHKSSKEKDSSTEKSHKSDHKSSEKSKQKEESSSSKHKDSSDKHKSSKSDSNSEKHNSNNTEKHSSKSDKGKSSSHSHKSDKDKSKSSSSGKETSVEKHKSKESDGHSSKEKHSSSSKEKSKDRSSSSKEKSEHSHKSEKKHSSSDKKSKHSENKHKSERRDEENDETKAKRKSSSSSAHTSKASSSKSKVDIPKKKSNDNGVDSDDGINCESGASFAEALGMISPTKPKKKTKVPLKDAVSPNFSNIEDLSAAALLAPTAKLAPLPALEISALPEISPNYKPRPPPKLLPHFTDEEAMSTVMSSKNQRTKVYSGNKVIGKIPTLYEMCVQVLQEHIDALEYTGGVPYDILKPVVDRATPQQLFMLEHFNPYLMEDTDHLWQKFCEKHFRNKQRQEMETSREMYMRCQEEQEHRLKSLTANIKIAQEKAKAPIKQTKMAYVDTVVKPPRNIARKQAQHGTAHAAAASPAARVASLAAAPNVLRGSARPAPHAPAIFAPQRPKKAPLMQKALQFMRGRKR